MGMTCKNSALRILLARKRFTCFFNQGIALMDFSSSSSLVEWNYWLNRGASFSQRGCAGLSVLFSRIQEELWETEYSYHIRYQFLVCCCALFGICGPCYREAWKDSVNSRVAYWSINNLKNILPVCFYLVVFGFCWIWRNCESIYKGM